MHVLDIRAGSDYSRSHYGESEELIRSLAEQSNQVLTVPMALIIEEADSLVPNRESGRSHEINLLSTLLNIIGSNRYPNLMYVFTTNRMEAMDDAVKRSGRLEHKIYFGRCDVDTRSRLVEQEWRKMATARAVHHAQTQLNAELFAPNSLVSCL